MPFLTTIWNIIQVLIGYNLILPILLFFMWLIFGKKRLPKITSPIETEPDYAIIVTAYQFTDNLEAVVKSIKKVNYSNYIIYIVADNCDISNLKFEDEKVVLLKPDSIIASNTGSHQYAIDHFIRNHQRLTIIDSDNLVHPEYFQELNKYFNKGYIAVQGIRSAKNLDTTYSRLDAARDIYYHFYDGKVLNQLGSSATLAGSGMAFNTDLYKDFLKQNQVKGAGFDKILQYFIIKQDLRIAFAENAVVFDEKTSQSHQLVKQRARWINTWLKYFKLGFTVLRKGIMNFSLNQTLFGVILLRPPLFIFLILSFICLFINIITGNYFNVTLWSSALIVFVIGFALALLFSETDKKIYSSLIGIPKFVFLQIISLIKSRNANKHSVATQHYHTKNLEEID
ncbi:cell wall biogenesis glycosyltransferase-like protein [Pseudopedobacter saltans DSM 12145]|uniref:Cell wall biogenesis glycosyltransferase-like protein n=1 Tax=Pseudopedobacter saltans (strain ATCC 51119 / DSM 12145 / JCM 21818 / CCUG 39354 / LMG 10337 / NBRC 100064 / NCIMB 13643) TaxID=762903 RepID=F0SBF9_PSESL|nr:glycosyltransferase [Pseudopedobacter saltans]ADY51605.1 cell wall biogenesis glycosyltransferase-like protein [Pseudopedobacter saltans DSM 12145]